MQFYSFIFYFYAFTCFTRLFFSLRQRALSCRLDALSVLTQVVSCSPSVRAILDERLEEVARVKKELVDEARVGINNKHIASFVLFIFLSNNIVYYYIWDIGAVLQNLMSLVFL